MNRNPNLLPDTTLLLQQTLYTFNRYSQFYLHTHEILRRDPSKDIAFCIMSDPATDLRRYNLPTVDEIAFIIPGDETQAVDPRDIILRPRSGGLQHISDLHAYIPRMLLFITSFFSLSGLLAGLPRCIYAPAKMMIPNMIFVRKE